MASALRDRDPLESGGLAAEIDDARAGRTIPIGDDAILRSAVERQFEIVGEALTRLSRVDPHIAAQIDDLVRIVALRSVLIHGYATIDDALVWQVATPTGSGT